MSNNEPESGPKVIELQEHDVVRLRNNLEKGIYRIEKADRDNTDISHQNTETDMQYVIRRLEQESQNKRESNVDDRSDNSQTVTTDKQTQRSKPGLTENLTNDNSNRTQNTTTQLKFTDKHIEPILNGQKTATIRYELDSHSAFRVGQKFDLADTNGERFASATVHNRGCRPAETIVENGVTGHKPYTDLEGFYHQMREYYPRIELGPRTCFEIIHWDPEEVYE